MASLVSEKCRRCYYHTEFKSWLNEGRGDLNVACAYIIQEKKKRPCEAGDNCTVFCTGKKERINPYGGVDPNVSEYNKELIKECIEERKKYEYGSKDYLRLTRRIYYLRHHEVEKKRALDRFNKIKKLDEKYNDDTQEVLDLKEERKQYKRGSEDFNRITNRIAKLRKEIKETKCKEV